MTQWDTIFNGIQAFAAIGSFVVYVILLWYAYHQFKITHKIGLGQFRLDIFKSVQRFNKIDWDLRDESWPAAKRDEGSERDWLKVSRYMNFFEHIHGLV